MRRRRGLGQQLGGAGATEDKGGPGGSAEPGGIEGMGVRQTWRPGTSVTPDQGRGGGARRLMVDQGVKV